MHENRKVLALDSFTSRFSDAFVGNRDASDRRVVEIANRRGLAPVIIACEHASHHIPEEFDDLRLAAADRHSHAVWDPGASSLAHALSRKHDAPLVLGCVSRLIHDCNRPAASLEACPDRVERIDVPGNRGLTKADREARAKDVYFAFHDGLSELIAERDTPPVLVTVHSFSPTWHGAPRMSEIGLLHDADDRIARVMLGAATGPYRVELNEPYSAADGVTHTLAHHAERVRSSVMIEVRNDLLAQAQHLEAIADGLTRMLDAALEKMAAVP